MRPTAIPRRRMRRATSGLRATCRRWPRALETEPVLVVARSRDGRWRSTPDAGRHHGHSERPSALCDHMVFAGGRLAGDDSSSAVAYQAPDSLKARRTCTISRPGARRPRLSFDEAMMTGLARDGGLYVPELLPVMDRCRDRGAGRADLRRDRLSRDAPVSGRHLRRRRVSRPDREGLCRLRPCRPRAAGATRPRPFPAGTVPRADAGVQGFRHAADRSDVPGRACPHGRAGDDRRGDQRRYRVGRDRGVSRAAQCRCLHPVSRMAACPMCSADR